MTDPAREYVVLVLQGGGALGAYQAGAYEALAADGRDPDWVAGISIGAINAALIAGNRPEHRLERLTAFWQRVTTGMVSFPFAASPPLRRMASEVAAAVVVAGGVPGFFTPRVPPAWLLPDGTPRTASVYDTAPLARTLLELVDFDYLNERGPRLSVGAVDVATGNFAYFDSARERIGPEHVMASGALPPGLPAVTIDGRCYWDGGLVSNTPLQYVMEAKAGGQPLCIFQIDLFSSRGDLPANLVEVAQREKDIRYSSRTRLTTDRFRELHAIGAAARRLSEKLPESLRDDPDLKFLVEAGGHAPVTLVHLVHRKERFESQTKDFEFSRVSMTEHWAAGRMDVERTLGDRSWQRRRIPAEGIRVFDIGFPDAVRRQRRQRTIAGTCRGRPEKLTSL